MKNGEEAPCGQRKGCEPCGRSVRGRKAGLGKGLLAQHDCHVVFPEGRARDGAGEVRRARPGKPQVPHTGAHSCSKLLARGNGPGGGAYEQEGGGVKAHSFFVLTLRK